MAQAVFQDRPYQTEAVNSIWNYFYNGNTGNPLVAMPTGTGKSVVIARFLQSIYNMFPNQRVMMLTHVQELIEQNYSKLLSLWPFAPAGIYSAGLKRKDTHCPIIMGGIASVVKQWALFGKIDLLLIDEAHLVSPKDDTMYQLLIKCLKSINPKLKVIGFTATPWRMGHGLLTDPHEGKKGQMVPSIFSDICFDITGMEAFNRLIAEGYLVPLVPKRTKLQLNTDGVGKRGGEFIEGELQAAVDRDEITEEALKEAIELAEGRKKWLIFAAGTQHSDNIAAMLNMMGIPAASLHSKSGDRDEILRQFASGEIRALVNNNILTTGFDDPEIDCIIVLRPTASAVLWVQMLGRGTRPFWFQKDLYDLNTIEGRLACIENSGKTDCLVLDYAGNTKNLGPVNDPVVPRRKGQKGGTAPVKCCEVCDTWNHASRRHCGGHPYPTVEGCGSEFKFLTKIQMQASADELIKGDLPVVEVFKVAHITYSKHEKEGKPLMMRATYFCSNYKSFSDTVCFEHKDYAARKAKQWWAARSPTPVPTTVEDALERVVGLPPVTHLRVWTNKKYPEIMAICTDGTAFGKEEPSAPPAVDVEKERTYGSEFGKEHSETYCLDDEIPF